MPKVHPREIRDDGVAVVRKGEAPIKRISKDFALSEFCPRNWPQATDVGTGKEPGLTASEPAELSEAKKRVRLLEQENEGLRHAVARFP